MGGDRNLNLRNFRLLSLFKHWPKRCCFVSSRATERLLCATGPRAHARSFCGSAPPVYSHIDSAIQPVRAVRHRSVIRSSLLRNDADVINVGILIVAVHFAAKLDAKILACDASQRNGNRSEERREGKSVDRGGRRSIKKK